MQIEYTFEEKLFHIKEIILKNVPAKYIYLFGSYVYGEPSAFSDIDIYAVIPDEIEKDPFLRGKILGELGELKIYEIDLVIKNESKFNFRKDKSFFESTVIEKGKLIYEYN